MSVPPATTVIQVSGSPVCVYYTLDWRACISNQDFERLRVKKQWNVCNGTQGLVREIENFERSGVLEIGSKFALLYREKKRDRSFTSRDRELREIGVQAIESHLYFHSSCRKYHIWQLSSELLQRKEMCEWNLCLDMLMKLNAPF